MMQTDGPAREVAMPLIILLIVLLIPLPVSALDPGPEDVYVRVVDVGAGLCIVPAAPRRPRWP